MYHFYSTNTVYEHALSDVLSLTMQPDNNDTVTMSHWQSAWVGGSLDVQRETDLTVPVPNLI